MSVLVTAVATGSGSRDQKESAVEGIYSNCMCCCAVGRGDRVGSSLLRLLHYNNLIFNTCALKCEMCSIQSAIFFARGSERLMKIFGQKKRPYLMEGAHLAVTCDRVRYGAERIIA